MAKRFLVSLLLVAVVVAAVAVGATYMFRSSYESLAALQAQAQAQQEAEEQVPAELPEVPVMDSAEDFGAEDSALEEEAPVATVEPEDYSNTLRARAIAGEMSLEEKIYQMLFVTPEALTGYNRVTQSGSATESAISERPVGGLFYTESNLVSADQTAEMLEKIQGFAKASREIGLFLGIEEEGADVAPVAENLGTTVVESAAVTGETGDPQNAYELGFTIASDIHQLGFNLDFAPVADLISDEDNEDRSRSLGGDADAVSEMITQEVRGFIDGGVLCAPKYFPGAGGIQEETLNGFAASNSTVSQLEEADFKPFQAAIQAGAPMIMVGHTVITSVDGENPACLSQPVVTGLLRERLGYEGIIITAPLNDTEMINQYTYVDSSVQAIKAGCDMVLCVSGVTDVVSAVEAAVESGEISEDQITESVIRILTAKMKFGLAS